MVRAMPLSAAAVSILLLPSALAAGLYSKNSPVVQVDGGSYDNLIAKSNYTSIVEFYAPWCGHCKNLQPAFEKAAKSLIGLAKVAAVNCDDESNKPFCGSMGVQGFPTLKIVKPGRVKDGKKGKPIVEDYNGARTAKAIVDAVIDKIPNHVKRLSDKDYEAWLEDGDAAKAILFSDKGSTSATLKAIAIDFLGGMGVAQIRDKEREAVEVFNVDRFPTLVLLPGGDKAPITYGGEMKKQPMVEFLSQAVPPNPDPAPKKQKTTSSSSKDKSKSSKASSSFSKASESQASSHTKSNAASETVESVEDGGPPTSSPNPIIAEDEDGNPIVIDRNTLVPVKTREMPSIPKLHDGASLNQACLNSKSSTCILALTPPGDESKFSKDVSMVISILSEIQFKYKESDHALFPFFEVPASNPQASVIRSKLKLDGEVEIVAVNGKRSWYRHYSKAQSSIDVEEWVDAIRMGESKKERIPDGLIVDASELPFESIKIDTSDPDGMREALKSQLPDGFEVAMEEISDEEYERLMAQGATAGKRDEL